MRSLSATLLAAQKAASSIPYLEIKAKNKTAGVVRLDWDRLYTGSEDDCFHGLTIPGDGSLIRARATLAGDGRKLYRQRVTSPGPSSDFSSWTYTSQYNCVAVAAASNGTEVSICWINTSREIRRIKSTDYGATWGSPELIDYSPTTAINGLSAAYKSNGDLAIVFADQSTLYIKENISGWQSKVAWDKTTGDLSGAAVIYDSDWNILVTGKDSSGNFKLWSLIYGDGGDVASGTWSALKEFASAPSDGDFEFRSVFMDKPDVNRCFYVEKFSGTEAYNRAFRAHSVPGAAFLDNLWREPIPFNLSIEYGLAMANYGSYAWLSAPFGVWRADFTEISLDITEDVVLAKQKVEDRQGVLNIELKNDDGSYATLPDPLAIGCQIEFSPGYVTSLGNEVSTGQTFTLDSYGYVTGAQKAVLNLNSIDGWGLIKSWQARHQMRWNKSSDEMTVKQILEFILAKVGLKLEVQTESSVITGFYPDFVIHPGQRGDSVINRLLSLVPDLSFTEGIKIYLVNPQASDGSVYSYGASHVIKEGVYQQRVWQHNRATVEGYDPIGDNPILVDRFSWSQIDGLHDRLETMDDRNVDTVSRAEQRGDAHLRKAEVESQNGVIIVPVNCGQQLYDVIDVTDAQAGLSSEKKRVTGFTLNYVPGRGEYEQRLFLGAV